MAQSGRSLAALMLVGIVGCGDGGSSISVTYSPPRISDLVFDDELTSLYSCNTVTFVPIPEDVAVIRITDLGGAYAPTAPSITDLGGGSFLACPHYSPALAPGTHDGVLRLDLCKDPGCAAVHPLSDPDLAYTIRVLHVVHGLPLLDATILVDGVAAQGVVAGSSGEVRTYQVGLSDGQLLEAQLTNGTPARVYWERNATMPTVTSVPPYGRGILRVRMTLPDGLSSGGTTFTFRADDGRTIRLAVTVTR